MTKLDKYQAACTLYDAAFDVWHPVPSLYAAGKIADAEYLAARKVFEATTAVWEAARAAAYPGR